MKRKHRHTACHAMMLLLGLLVAGCSTTQKRGGMTPPVTPPGPDAPQYVQAEAAKQLLNVVVHAAPSVDEASKATMKEAMRVGDLLDDRVEGTLLAQGFRRDNGKPDVSVSLTVSTKLFDQSGNYFVYHGDVDATVARAHEDKLLGRQRFSAKGERGLEQGVALDNLVSALADKVAPWVTETAVPIQADIVANDITIRWGRLHVFDDAKYVRDFVARVGALTGVLRCELVDKNLPNRTMVFRVVYFKRSFPAGLMNSVEGVEGLNIKQ